MDTVRWGIVGPGRIADKVVRDLPLVKDAVATAVASRSAERAAAFAARHDIPRTHDSYRALIADPDVDRDAFRPPHPQHRAVALAALRAGKAVLVEKAFTVTPEATREIAALAAQTGVFAMEAMWTRFQPAVVRMRELIADGAVGEVRSVQADLGVRNPLDPKDRFVAPELGGGALFDLTVYPISFAQMVLGNPTVVAAYGVVAPVGIDVEETVLLGFDGGRTAALTATLRCATPGQARVFGTDGWIDVLPRFHHPDTIVLHRQDRDPQPVTLPATGGGYYHELVEVTECLLAGRAESTVMPLTDTIAVQDVMAAQNGAGGGPRRPLISDHRRGGYSALVLATCRASGPDPVFRRRRRIGRSEVAGASPPRRSVCPASRGHSNGGATRQGRPCRQSDPRRPPHEDDLTRQGQRGAAALPLPGCATCMDAGVAVFHSPEPCSQFLGSGHARRRCAPRASD